LIFVLCSHRLKISDFVLKLNCGAGANDMSTHHGERSGLLLDEREAFLFRLPATMMRVAKELLIEVCTLPQTVSAAACICRHCAAY
jgi:hypothetical protein